MSDNVITGADRDAILRIMDKVRADLAPRLDEKNAADNVRKIVVAEQTLRVCLETVLASCVPYNQQVPAELAIRLAAYCVTAAPIEDHRLLAEMIAGGIPSAVKRKVSQGFMLRTEWRQDAT